MYKEHIEKKGHYTARDYQKKGQHGKGKDKGDLIELESWKNTRFTPKWKKQPTIIGV